jgi:RNA-directed DNA polymerase
MVSRLRSRANRAYPGAPRWVKRRPYPHFDAAYQRSRLRQLIEARVKQRRVVATWSFLPFIKTYRVTPKYYSTENGRRRKKLKRRPICYASHADSHVFARYASILYKRYEERLAADGLCDCVLAYRSIKRGDGRGKSNVDHAGEVFAYIAEHVVHGPLVALAFDIEKFFDTMDHDQLKDQWLKVLDPAKGDLTLDYDVKLEDKSTISKNGDGDHARLPKDHFNVYKAITQFDFVEEEDLKEAFAAFYDQPRVDRKGLAICTPRQFQQRVRGNIIQKHSGGRGIPQGSPISAVASNIYLRPLDQELHREIAKLDGCYRRYSDDLMVVVPMEHLEAAREAVVSAVEKCKLKVQHEKTDELTFSRGPGNQVQCLDDKGNPSRLQYLGFTYDGTDVAIRQSSLNRYTLQFRRAIPRIIARAKKRNEKYNRQLDARTLIYKLFTRFGKRTRRKNGKPRQNFVLYAERACDTLESLGLCVDPIKYEIDRHMRLVQRALIGRSRRKR